MSPQPDQRASRSRRAVPRRALALLLAVLVLPLASAQDGPIVDPDDAEPPEQVDCTQPVESCFPDLIPSNPTMQTVDERYPGTACTDFLNIGDAPTATAFRVRLEVDGIATAERQFSKTYQRGEGEANVCWDGIHLVGGRHTMTIIVDAYGEVPESDERNNARTVSFHVRFTPRVDLRLTSFTVTPLEGGPRDNQVFFINVTNVGTETSNQTTINLTDDNGHMATFHLKPLRPRESYQVAHATRPEFRPVGTFIAHASVDPLGTNSEIDELNNDALLEYTVLEHPAPDLVITNVTLSGNFTEFRGVVATVTVKNVGDQFGRDVVVRAVNESDFPVQEAYKLGIFPPNATTTLQLRLVLRAGEREIRLLVDPYQRVMEKDELNNVHALALNITKPVVHVDEPNLVIERLYALPSDPRPGDTVSVGALVRNIGTDRSNATTVNFTIDGRAIGTAPVPALGRNTSHAAYVPWVPTTAGLVQLLAVADPRSTLKELDEEDNALTLQFVVAQPPPPPPEEGPATNITPPPVLNATPTPPTAPTPPRPTNTSGAPIALGEMSIETRPVPGGLKGIVSVSLRNPNIQPVGLLEVTFKAGDQVLKQVLVGGIRGAASVPATTGEVDLPPGNQTVTAEVRVVGSTIAPVVRSDGYDVAAGEKEGVPAPGAALVLALAAALALARARRPRAR